MLKSLLLVGVGGAAGSLFRYILSRLLTSEVPFTFPYGTFAVNIIGCLLIGVIYGLGLKELSSSSMRLLLGTGFCGGFTTFSSFSLEFLLLLREGHANLAFLYAAASMILGLSAVWLGLLFTKAV